jgi:alpha-maltose-1-phosphate synthase
MAERKKTGAENAVLFHHPDAVDTARENLMGRHSAGQGFLHGFVRHSGVDQFYCQGMESFHGEDFANRIAAIDTQSRESTFVPIGMMGRGSDLPGTLTVPGPSLGMYAWRRRLSAGARAYSLCGVTYTIASDTVMDGVGELLTAPIQFWDAVICISNPVKASMTRMLDNWADYLGRRSGGRFKADVHLPVIPLGVNCADFGATKETDGARISIRRGLGIGDDDIAVLYFGRLSFHAKAHPMPMYLALEEAVKRTGKKFHLLQVGRFPNEGVEREFRDGVRRYCPSVNGIFLDGRDMSVSRQVWFAADIFTSFSDNIQESFGLTVIEAMAAGLPVVVSDWDGYKDTVRHGEDGFRIPTWLPLPDSGTDIAIQLESALDPEAKDRAYNHYCGYVSQATSIDIAAAAEAFSALAIDPALRKRLGTAGQIRAKERYDWSVIIGMYQELWQDLANRRNASVESAPTVQGRPLHPLRDDPFSLFAEYPTHTIDGDAVVSAAVSEIESGEEVDLHERLRELRALSMNEFAAQVMLNDQDIQIVLEMIEEKGAVSVISLAEPLAENVRFRLPRTLGWLAKIGLLQLNPPGAASKAYSSARTPAKTEAQSLVDLGARARSRGAIEAAGDYFVKALKADPDHAEANFHYGELLALSQQYDNSADFLRRAVRAENGFIVARRSLGKVLFLKGDEKEAVKVLKETVELVPDDAESHYLLGAGYRRAGTANKAVTHLERVLDIEPERVDALAHLALARKSLGRRDDAIEAISKGLSIEPNNVFAQASMASLKVEDRGRTNIGRQEAAKRVGFHLNQIYQYPLLKPLFDGFSVTHWPLITGDGRELMEFEPDVVVICDTQAASLRKLVPKATIVNIGAGLASKNFHSRITDPGDYLCVSSKFTRDETIERMGLSKKRIWDIGYPPMDPLFKEEALAMPFDTPLDRKTVLYAPTHNAGLTSALMLAENPVEMLLGDLKEVNLIIKPHPRLSEQRPGLVEQWQKDAADRDDVWLVTDASLDVAPFLKAADVLVSDASSVIFEYLALDRPMVLIEPTVTQRDKAFFDPDGLEWRWRDMGIRVKDTAFLADAVARALKDPDDKADVRSAYSKKLFGTMSDGKAMGRLLAKVKNL